jgi:hypothetical protein
MWLNGLGVWYIYHAFRRGFESPVERHFFVKYIYLANEYVTHGEIRLPKPLVIHASSGALGSAVIRLFGASCKICIS